MLQLRNQSIKYQKFILLLHANFGHDGKVEAKLFNVNVTHVPPGAVPFALNENATMLFGLRLSGNSEITAFSVVPLSGEVEHREEGADEEYIPSHRDQIVTQQFIGRMSGASGTVRSLQQPRGTYNIPRDYYSPITTANPLQQELVDIRGATADFSDGTVMNFVENPDGSLRII